MERKSGIQTWKNDYEFYDYETVSDISVAIYLYQDMMNVFISLGQGVWSWTGVKADLGLAKEVDSLAQRQLSAC